MEERISLARLLYSHQSQAFGPFPGPYGPQEKPVSLREVKLLQGSSARVTLQGATASARKLYVPRRPLKRGSLGVAVDSVDSEVKNLFKLVSGKAFAGWIMGLSGKKMAI